MELRRCAAEPSSRRFLLLHAPGSISFCNASPWLYCPSLPWSRKGGTEPRGGRLGTRLPGRGRSSHRPQARAAGGSLTRWRAAQGQI